MVRLGKAQPLRTLGTSRGSRPTPQPGLGTPKPPARSGCAARAGRASHGGGLTMGREVPGRDRSLQDPRLCLLLRPGSVAGQGAATHRQAPAEEGLQEGGLACAPRSQHLAQEHVPLGLPLLQVNPLLPGHWQERGWVRARRDPSCDRRGGHGCTCEGLGLGVLLREDGVAQVAQALQAVPYVQVSHEPGETEHARRVRKGSVM